MINRKMKVVVADSKGVFAVAIAHRGSGIPGLARGISQDIVRGAWRSAAVEIALRSKAEMRQSLRATVQAEGVKDASAIGGKGLREAASDAGLGSQRARLDEDDTPDGIGAVAYAGGPLDERIDPEGVLLGLQHGLR